MKTINVTGLGGVTQTIEVEDDDHRVTEVPATGSVIADNPPKAGDE